MKTRSSISILLSCALFAACSGKDKKTASAPETAAKDHAVKGVTFNNGGKWSANPETTAGIDRMRSLISGFTTVKDPSTHPKLIADLEREYADIIKNCTMTGEAHNQLHKFLAPITKMMEPLKAGDPKVVNDALIKLDNHLKTYSAYFE